MKELTFVIGAGASAEYNLPVGKKLKSDIIEVLRPRQNSHAVQDQELYYAICREYKSATQEGDASRCFEAADLIRRTISLSPSIDNFINSHKGDKRIEIVSKLAIAKCILESERASSLYFMAHRRIEGMLVRGYLNYAGVEDKWLGAFFKLITQDCSFLELKDKLAKVSLVIFNYDRCVEHFLFEAVKDFYDVDDESARDALSFLNVFHPYGLISNLPWQIADGIAYGAEHDADVLAKAAKNIRTFSESVSMEELGGPDIKEVVSNTNKLVLLGFGYIPLNMQLLGSPQHHPDSKTKTIFATSLGFSEYDANKIGYELKRLCGSDRDPQMKNCTAADLFSAYTRGIRF